MSESPFSQVYLGRVLDPSYANWLKFFYAQSFKVHRAHLCMLFEAGIVDSSKARAIKSGIDAIEKEFSPPEHIPGYSGGETARATGSGSGTRGFERVEDLYFLVEKELGLRIGEENAAWLHTARSRNDMDTTVFRLALKGALLEFLAKFRDACAEIESRARKGEGELTILFTHGQPANPSTTAHYLTAFLLDLLDDGFAIAESIGEVDQSSMGSCAITGTGFPIDRKRVAELLGMGGSLSNTYRAISTSHWLVRPAQALAASMLDVGRFTVDLLHKASAEVGLYDFPDDLVQVSSIMPQKRNPVILEHVRIQAGQVAGVCRAIEDAFRNVPYQDVNENADALVAQFIVALSEAQSVLDLLAEAVKGLRAREKDAEKIAARFGVTSTELADELVRKFGIGFRTAHGLCSGFARSGGDKDNLRENFGKAVGRPLPWSDSEIDAILDPRHFVQVRSTLGGPSAGGMESVWKSVRARSAEIEETLGDFKNGLVRASAELAEAWDNIG